jgi:hypothetical protein
MVFSCGLAGAVAEIFCSQSAAKADQASFEEMYECQLLC